MTADDEPTTAELRAQQASKAREERRSADEAATEDEAATHDRRADKAAYLASRLVQQEQSEHDVEEEDSE